MRAELLVLGRFADDPQRVLAAVYRFALVGVKRCLDLVLCSSKLRVAAFTDAEHVRVRFTIRSFRFSMIAV